MDVSEYSKNSRTNETFYSLKYDTRLAGPWTDHTYTKPEYIPRQFRGLMDRLYPWQQSVLDSRNVFNDRVVNLISSSTTQTAAKVRVPLPVSLNYIMALCIFHL